jgi:hypothetical protein
MNKILLIVSFLLIGTYSVNAQKNINSYKYVLLPQKFDFLKKEDQYRMNTRTRFLLKKSGFNVYYNNERFPEDLAVNNCLALKANVIEISTLLKTKLKVEFRNCYNEIIYVSDEGVSKEKLYKEAYVEALIKAFRSVEDLKYSYQPGESKVVSSESLPKDFDKAMIEDKRTKDDVVTNEIIEKKTIESNIVLKAFPTKNGYTLKDSKGKTIHQVLKSQRDDMFILSNNEGVLYRKEGNKWIREFMKDNEITTEILYIEF